MAVLRYWDRTVSAWKYAATDPDNPGLVSAGGDTITGPFPLVVNAGAGSYDITIDGAVDAKSFTTTKGGVLNVGIRIGATAGRMVDFGGAAVQEVADAAEADAAVTKGKVDTFALTWDSAQIELNGTHWATMGSVYARPGARLDREGRVALEGFVRRVAEVDEVIGTLPVGYRPGGRVALSALCIQPELAHVRLDVLPGGEIVCRRSIPGCVIGLDGCSFYAAGGV